MGYAMRRALLAAGVLGLVGGMTRGADGGIVLVQTSDPGSTAAASAPS